MASFLRKFVKAKSRSKSPAKPPPAGGAEFRPGDDRFRLFDGNNSYGYGPHEPYMGHMGQAADGRSVFGPSSSAAPPYSVGMPRKSDSYRQVAVPPLLSEYSHGGAPLALGDAISPYSTRQRRFLDAEDLSDPPSALDGVGPPLGYVGDRLSRRDTGHSPIRRKSPPHNSESPTRRTIPNSLAAALVASSSSSQQAPPYGNSPASPMLSSQPQYYFTPDYKVYEDVASENELRVPGTPQQPYSPLLSGHSNTTTTYYQEPGPSSSNTLTPAWHGADRRRPFSATLRPTSSGYMNGGVAGSPHFGGAPPPPTPTGGRDVAYGTFHASNGYLSGGTGPTNGSYYVPSGAPLSAAAVRPRSTSPRKALKGDNLEERKFRSRSPTKRPSITKTVDYLQPQCRLEGCSAVIIVEDARFLVCKHQISHASEFFRTLFLNNRALPVDGVRQTAANEYTIVVSGLRHPPQSVQFQWFIESAVLCPVLKPIADNSLETCMRLSKRFDAKGLELRCAKFIQENVEDKPPMMALCWLNWAFKHRFDRPTLDACAPVVARLPLAALERHRQMLPERAVAALIAAKLRVCYQQSAKVFYTIHRMDHFHVDMERCPRCGRQREQGKVRVQANPCHKLIGCERCLQDFGCAIESNAGGDFEAFHQCEHGALQPFNERAEDCACQTPLYRLGYGGSAGAAYGSVVPPDYGGDASTRRTTIASAPTGRPSTSGSKSN